MPSQNDAGEPWPSNQNVLNLLYGAARCAAALVVPLVRFGYGSEFLGMPGVIALVLLLTFAAADPWVKFYFLLWLTALVVQRFVGWRRRRAGQWEHSLYGGWPWVGALVPFVKKEITAQRTEPLICFGVAVLLSPVSEPLATLLAAGAAGLFVMNAMNQEVLARRRRRLRDARIEAQLLSRMAEEEGELF